MLQIVDDENVIADDLAKFVDRVTNLRRVDQRQVDRAVRRQFAGAFSRQGDNRRWAPLAEATVQQRNRLGFPGRAPILIRTGDYMRTFTKAGEPDHISEYEQRSDGWVLESGSKDERVQWLETGTRRMPARPVTDLSSASANRITDTVDAIFERIFESITS